MKTLTLTKPKVLKKIKAEQQRKQQKSRRRFLKDIFPARAILTQSNYQFDGPSTKGIAPYTGPWTFQEAGHLLRRTTFGPTITQIEEAVSDGLNATIDTLLAPQPEPGEPLNSDFPNDPNVPEGTSWIDKPFVEDLEDDIYEYRHFSLRGWQYEFMVNEKTSIQETMALFWHNHFVTGDIDEPNALYRYIKLLRSQATGNFKQLTKDITIDAAMLTYLNGRENIASEPNENYARELLELFTIGKGPLIGPGDYTHYTEKDVEAVAKIMTGWFLINDWTYNINEKLEVVFDNDLHDQSTKQLSNHFGNATISNNGAEEYKDLIDVVFQQDEVARHIVRKLYRWFVYYDINETVELKVIEPLAQILIANEYDIEPVLETLLKSEHFFDVLSMGCMIKNPIDFNLTIIKQLEVQIPTELKARYSWLVYVFYISSEFGMEYFSPPSVAGWKAYYQVPSYQRVWMNSVTLKNRESATGAFIYTFTDLGLLFGIKPIALLQALDNPSDPDEVIAGFTKLLLPMPLADSQKEFLKKEVLIPGLPDMEWTMEYNNYLSNPGDENIKEALKDRIQFLLYMISVLPEYHLK